MTQNCYYDSLLNAVVANYDGFILFDEFKAISLSILEQLKHNETSKVLVNIENMESMLVESFEWIEAEWFPVAIAAGLKSMAFVVPHEAFAKAGMEFANQKAQEDGHIEIQYFDKIDEATTWIKEA